MNKKSFHPDKDTFPITKARINSLENPCCATDKIHCSRCNSDTTEGGQTQAEVDEESFFSHNLLVAWDPGIEKKLRRQIRQPGINSIHG